jgi:hypothetical protein
MANDNIKYGFIVKLTLTLAIGKFDQQKAQSQILPTALGTLAARLNCH